jgi:hypothetical protein
MGMIALKGRDTSLQRNHSLLQRLSDSTDTGTEKRAGDKMRIAAFALMLVVAAALPAWSGTSTAYSGMFGVNNTAAPGSTPASPWNPYGPSGSLVRGQLHCHRISGTSSYSITSSELANRYMALGYGFVAQTEHHFKPGGISPESIGWAGWAPNSTEITYSGSHVLGVGMSEGTTESMVQYPDTGNKALDTAIRVSRVHSRAGLAFVAHPDSVPYALSWKDLLSVWRQSSPDGMGVYTPGNDSQGKWNQVIAAYGRPVWGYVEDDYHPDTLSSWKLGRTWMAVPGSTGEWWGNIKERLIGGNSYCYWTPWRGWPGGSPPVMHVSVTMSGSQPVVSASFDQFVDRIEFIGWNYGRFGVLRSSTNLTGDSYTANGSEKFVRVLARKDFLGGSLYMASQPVMITRYGYISGYGPNAVGNAIAATSPELIIRYLEQEELPAPPPAGYVGSGYDVSTADGLVPPSATLELSYDGEDTSALGGTQYLAIYRYDEAAQQWVKVGGTVDPVAATIEAPITALGKYCMSADLPEDTTAPEVFIDNPPCGAVVALDTTVRATTNDDLGAWRVSFYLNDHLLKEDSDALDFWTADITLSDYCTGDWTLKAVAEDLAGNTGTAEIPIYIHSSTPRPNVSITSPTAGMALSGTVTATGACWDDVAVASVALTLDGTLVGHGTVDNGVWSCEIDTTYLLDGARTLTATVEDHPGNSATASVQVNVSNGGTSPPIGSLKNLEDGSTARLSGGIVVAGTDLVDGGFYVESPDRSSGIRVITDRTVSAGDIVSVAGSVVTVGTEKAVQAYDLLITSSGNALPRPIGINIPWLPKHGLDHIGKNIKVWGSVISSNPSERWFTLDGGPGYSVKCTVPVGVEVPTTGLVTVTGVCSVDSQTGQAVILVASPTQIRTPSQ